MAHLNKAAFGAAPRRSTLSKEDDSGEGLDRQTQEELIAMGIASPVTKETAGAR